MTLNLGIVFRLKIACIVSVLECVILISVCSCSHEDYEDKGIVEVIDNNILQSAKELTDIYDIDLTKCPQVKTISVLYDSIFVTDNQMRKGQNFISVYDGDFNIIREFARHGKGHDEFLMSDMWINGNEIIANDIIQGQYMAITIDSLACLNYFPHTLTVNHSGLTSICIWNSDSVIAVNPHYFRDKEMNIKQGIKRLMVIGGAGDEEMQDKEIDVDTWNVTEGSLLFKSPDNKRLIFADCSKSLIEIYDSSLTLVKTIEGPVDLKAEYGLENGDDSSLPSLYFKGMVPSAYSCFCTDDTHLYLCYNGTFCSNMEEQDKMPTYIFKMDWDGNIKDVYKYGINILSLSKSKDKDTFYVSVIDSVGDLALRKISTIPIMQSPEHSPTRVPSEDLLR